MNSLTKILTAACILAATAMLLNPASAEAKGRSSAAPKKATKFAVQTMTKTKTITTASKAKLLTLAKKSPKQFQKAKPVSLVGKHNHRRHYQNLCWNFGCYVGGWDPCFASSWTSDEYVYTQPTTRVIKTSAATMQDSSDDDDSDDSGDADDSDVDGICVNR